MADERKQARSRKSKSGGGKGGKKAAKPAAKAKAAKAQTAAKAKPVAAAGAEAELTAAEVAAAGDGHSEFALSDDSVEIALQTGDHAGLLEDYFGAEGYEELRQLAREAASRRVRGGPKVWILPGIMGSKIGKRRGLFDDVCWLDPADVARGQLARLTLAADGSSGLEALGVILLAYLKLKLRLQIAGYDAAFHAFDWRRSISDLGAELAARLKQENKGVKAGEEKINLVAHSMGGLVARAALAQGGRCRRLVMLGTPNFGSFAPVLALRAAYPIVRKLAALDLKHSAEELAEKIFSTFPGLTQMLPNPERWHDLDLYDLDVWPADRLRPRQEILAGVAAVQKGLAGGDGRMFLVAGVEQETVTGVERQVEDGVVKLLYRTARAGDGTVPLALCELPGIAGTFYVEESHGSLPNNKQVARAVADLLDRGETAVLTTERPAERRAGKPIPEQALRVDPFENRRGGRLSQRELRALIEEVAAPATRDAVAPPSLAPTLVAAGAPAAQPGFQHPFEEVVVGRRRQHRIDLTFARGSVTEVDARAIALGIFRDVAPSGAASALDRRLEGAITELSRRRMFSGDVGEIFILPTGRHDLRADLIAFVGLGPFDRFNSEVLQTAAENIIRTFVNTRVEEFATVLFGAGSGGSVADALRNLLSGFVRGLLDADRQHRFRRIVLCEYDSSRYTEIKQELYRLSSTPLCREVEMTFNEEELPEERSTRALPQRLAVTREDPAYLIVRRECLNEDKSFDVRSSLLTAGAKATVVTGVKRVAAADFAKLRREVERVRSSDFSQVGQDLSRLFLAEEVQAVLQTQARLPVERQNHLVVVHDAPLSQVTWEAMAFQVDGGEPWYPAAGRGLSHRYAADNLSVAKWLEDRIEDDKLSVLLVVDPTLDLPGAEAEGHAVREVFSQLPGCELEVLWQQDATRPALLSAFSSGKYDVIHYAGHAFFDEATPERSGVVCHQGVPLTGADLAGLGNLPTLVFFNACESSRVRGGKRQPPARLAQGELVARVSQAVGLAESFMRGGVANFIGTYWPVGDAEALTFSETFYKKVLLGVAEDGAGGPRRPASLGEAFQAARLAVKQQGSKDWADYILYGNPGFVLKAPGG